MLRFEARNRFLSVVSIFRNIKATFKFLNRETFFIKKILDNTDTNIVLISIKIVLKCALSLFSKKCLKQLSFSISGFNALIKRLSLKVV